MGDFQGFLWNFRILNMEVPKHLKFQVRFLKWRLNITVFLRTKNASYGHGIITPANGCYYIALQMWVNYKDLTATSLE